MPFYIDVHYAAPQDDLREDRISAMADGVGGQLYWRLESWSEVSHLICLTYEFADPSSARQAAARLSGTGEQVEGPFGGASDCAKEVAAGPGIGKTICLGFPS